MPITMTLKCALGSLRPSVCHRKVRINRGQPYVDLVIPGVLLTKGSSDRSLLPSEIDMIRLTISGETYREWLV